MKLYSTNNKNNIVDLKEAVLKSLPKDKGLYLPTEIPKMNDDFFKSYHSYDFNTIAYQVGKRLIGDYISDQDFNDIIQNAFDFNAPLVKLSENIYSLELFHGPSLAFKDFGARFMAQLISYFNRDENKKITILVATSGDTGGAVASGFFNTEGVEVIILYPSGKVSPLQEKQLTTWGNNISAVEISGSFDDCQAFVKQAFLDEDLNKKYNLSSANSINIARLIPQSFYYFNAVKYFEANEKVIISVPSGNFGNLTAGYMAYLMGLPVDQFIAATNVNNVVPQYIENGIYETKPSIQTISNAMDVGNPSNYIRLLTLTGSTWNKFTKMINGYYLSDKETIFALKQCNDKYEYICDPHGAIAFKSVEERLLQDTNNQYIFLETAHPSKFLDIVENSLNIQVEIPIRLKELSNKKKSAEILDPSYKSFKSYLMNRL